MSHRDVEKPLSVLKHLIERFRITELTLSRSEILEIISILLQMTVEMESPNDIGVLHFTTCKGRVKSVIHKSVYVTRLQALIMHGLVAHPDPETATPQLNSSDYLYILDLLK